MEVTAGYKKTDVGLIPAEWAVSTISKSMRLINGCAFKPNEWRKQGVPIIRIQNLNDPAADFNYFQGQIDERNRVVEGDVLFAWSGTLGSSFGARIWSGPDGVLNQHIFKVIADERVFTKHYSYLIFKRVQEDIEKKSHGFKSSFVHVKKADIDNIQLPIPPLPEQRAIATALSDVDALLAKLDQFIAKKRDLKQAAMQQLLTAGQTRLPGFSGKWGVKSFGDVLSRVNAKEHQIQTSDYRETGDYPVVDQGKELVIGYSDRGDKRFQCPEDGVIVFGDHTCIIKFVDFDFVVGADGTQILSAKKDHCTRFHAFQLEYSGIPTTGYNRHFKFLKERTFPAPPLPEQTAIATVLSDMDTEIAALETRRDKTRALKQGMMQELLTGRIRLV